MATCAELQARLAEAELAYHNRMTGGKVIQLRLGEKMVSYDITTQGGLDRLLAYIRTTSDQVAACTGNTTTLRRRAFGVIPQG